MARYRPEPAFSHGTPPRTAVLLANLGTPESPTASALRPYLKQFLWDPRVVEIPRPLWWLILNGIILNTRPKKSAEKYASVWTEAGSPLRAHTEQQARLLADALAGAGRGDVVVDYAMRYGEPSIPAVLDALRARHCTRILVVPMYPQYAASTTASVTDEAARRLLNWRNLPEMRFVRSFCDHPGYIAALADSVRQHWAENGEPERLVMSFHGVPRFTLDKGDPYHCECQKTGRLLVEALGIDPARALLTFQSRFGKAEWLQPYTQPTIEQLARDGVKKVDVICPGFVADCLETIEEIGMECRDAFLANGGTDYALIPCLNERDSWIAALSDVVRSHLAGWPEGAVDSDALAASAERAKALGAAR
ncbi:MAG: ferrochelatase [Rhodocyclaceae bacterium]|nr:ferrochelatase [Rhodocyclaceae bacterium]